jgi:protein-S-isoprenylcysteine O-methyltransferase Ste14
LDRVVVIINTVYFILAEEPALERQFGNDYRRYKQHVPRWLPRWHPYANDSSG